MPEGTIRADRQRLERALLNILANSAEYAGCGGRVFLRAEVCEETLRITVEDSGPGFTKEALQKGKEEFYTGSSARSGKAFGAGAVHCRQNYRRAWGKTGAGKFGSPWGRACVCLAAALTIE